MVNSAHNGSQLGQSKIESTSVIKGSSDPGAQTGVVYVPPVLEHSSFANIPEDISMTPTELDIIKLTAQFEAVYGSSFRLVLSKSLSEKPELEPRFDFYKPSRDTKHLLFCQLVGGYSMVLLNSQMLVLLNTKTLKEKFTSTAKVLVEKFFEIIRQVLEKENEHGVEMALTYLHAFECFVSMEYYVPPPDMMKLPVEFQLDEGYLEPQQPISFPVLPEGIPIKELDIIKLTAQFVAVFGTNFEQDLIKNNPEFQFLLPTATWHDFYSGLVDGYSRVLLRSENLRKEGASTETVRKGFHNLVQKVLGKKEEGPEIDTVDLQAFEYFVDMVYTDSRPIPFPGYLSILKNPPQPLMQPAVSSHPPPPPSEEPDPKKQKLDQSTLVPQDHFLAQHPIKISGTFEVTVHVQSLSENLASLKEKIAKKMEFRGKAGVLEEDKSLEDYNIVGGEEITLSLK